MVGTDVDSGAFRFTLGFTELTDGLSIVAVALGIFGIAEILRNLEQHAGHRRRHREDHQPDAEPGGPARRPRGRSRAARCSARSSARCRAAARSCRPSRPIRWRSGSRAHPERFGKGAIEGVAGPESANNAGAQTSFIPMLTLGIPSHPLMALMIGALMIQGITPGPNVVNEQAANCSGASSRRCGSATRC